MYADILKSLYPGRTYLIRKIVERLILQLHYAKIICVSETLSRQLNSLGVPDHRLAVIPNGVDAERFNPNIESPIKNAFGIDDCFLVSYFGRLWSVKGVEFLVGAIPEIASKISNVKCLIVGDGPQRNVLSRMARDLGVEDSMIFHPSVPYDVMPIS